MSNALTRQARALQMDPTEKAVLMALADMAREPDDAEAPSQAWPPMHGKDGKLGLCQWTCLSERSIQRAVKALVAAGHISRRQLSHGALYTVHPRLPSPVTQSGDSVSGDTQSGDSLSPSPVTQSPKAPISRKRKKTTSSPSTAGPVEIDQATLPVGATEQQWGDFAAMRVEMARGAKGRPWTAAAARKVIEKLQALADAGHDPGAVLDQSVLNGWQGVFPLKDNDHGRGRSILAADHGTRGPRPDPAFDLYLAARAELAAESACEDQGSDRGAWPALPPYGAD